MSQRPHLRRTWSPRGQTPVLIHHFHWDPLSAVAGATFWNFYFRLYKGTIRSPQVVEFLGHLVTHLRRPLLIIWDRLPAHRSRLVREYLDRLRGWVAMEYLPAYAPELNPVEFLWSYWKENELPNLCPRDFWHLSWEARQALKRMRRRPRLIRAFWKQAELCF